MNEFRERMKERTLGIAVMVLEVCDKLPATSANSAITSQLVRSITSVGANYREACRAKSRADFISKMQTVEAECDESLYWLALIEARHHSGDIGLQRIKQELNELLSIVVRAVKTAKKDV
ncbi:MAG TPA: four helix bundle protein [Bacteroidales bacterium]|nr:four helix bundle protein [Bacteroidales bacterium]HSA42747.1 four helix bundle protein [Bacteroidales bacterium]